MFLIEATAAMQQFWHTMRTLFVEPLLRYIDKGQFGRVELAVVLVSAPDLTGDQPVDGTCWTTSVSDVRSMLDAVQFAGGGFGAVALGQALAQVVYLQTLPSSMPVSAPLPSGGSPPLPADPVVPCHCLMLLASPQDHLPVYVPGLRNPAASRPGLAHMHSVQSLMREVQKSYNMHLSLVVIHTREHIQPAAREYIQMLLHVGVRGCGGAGGRGFRVVQGWGVGRGSAGWLVGVCPGVLLGARDGRSWAGSEAVG